jgi:hypothetical protein
MPNPAPINDLPRMKYYLEYWKIGDSADQIQNCEFHSACIDGFVRKFSGLGKYTVLYLICLSDGTILIDRREAWSDRSLHSLIEDLKTVDQ